MSDVDDNEFVEASEAVLDGHPMQDIQPPHEESTLLLGGKGVVTTDTVAKECLVAGSDKKVAYMFELTELRIGNGQNRGAMIQWGTDKLVVLASYTFEDNIHKIPAYNKDPKKFYEATLVAFLSVFPGNTPPVASFTFNFTKVPVTANLVA